VRHSAQAQIQRQIEQDARNALLTIQAVQHQRELLLTRKADLLATLAYIRNGDSMTIQDASEDPWQSGDCDLFALADRKGKIIGLHTTSLRLSLANAQELLRRSLREDSATDGGLVAGSFFRLCCNRITRMSREKAAF
jgi:hypothetical protein